MESEPKNKEVAQSELPTDDHVDQELAPPVFEESDELRLKRYESLYELTKHGVAAAIERYRLLDEKAAKSFTALNILLAVVAFTSKEALEYLLPLRYAIDPFALALAGLSIVLLLVSLGFMIRVISIGHGGNLQEPPIDDNVIRLFHENQYTSAIFSTSRTNVEAINADKEASRKKALNLTKGSNCLLAAIICFGLFIGVFSIRLGFDSSKPRTIMNDKHIAADSGKSSSGQTQNTSQQSTNKVPLPDTTIRPLKPVPVSEGAQPVPEKRSK